MELTDRATEHDLCLTEDEALGLLDIIMLSPGELTPDQRAAVMKLSEFCRQFLREGMEASTALGRSGMPLHARHFAA